MDIGKKENHLPHASDFGSTWKDSEFKVISSDQRGLQVKMVS